MIHTRSRMIHRKSKQPWWNGMRRILVYYVTRNYHWSLPVAHLGKLDSGSGIYIEWAWAWALSEGWEFRCHDSELERLSEGWEFRCHDSGLERLSEGWEFRCHDSELERLWCTGTVHAVTMRCGRCDHAVCQCDHAVCQCDHAVCQCDHAVCQCDHAVCQYDHAVYQCRCTRALPTVGTSALLMTTSSSWACSPLVAKCDTSGWDMPARVCTGWSLSVASWASMSRDPARVCTGWSLSCSVASCLGACLSLAAKYDDRQKWDIPVEDWVCIGGEGIALALRWRGLVCMLITGHIFLRGFVNMGRNRLRLRLLLLLSWFCLCVSTESESGAG